LSSKIAPISKKKIKYFNEINKYSAIIVFGDNLDRVRIERGRLDIRR
jgi:hypothetical protein